MYTSVTGRRRREQGGSSLEGADKKNDALLRRLCKALGGHTLTDDRAEVREFTIG